MDSINIADEGVVPSSEVGFEGQIPEESNKSGEQPPPKSNLLQNMELLLSWLPATAQPQTTNANATMRLIRFDPDDADANIEDWCKTNQQELLARPELPVTFADNWDISHQRAQTEKEARRQLRWRTSTSVNVNRRGALWIHHLVSSFPFSLIVGLFVQ